MKTTVTFIDIALLTVATFAALIAQQFDIQSLEKRVASMEKAAMAHGWEREK